MSKRAEYEKGMEEKLDLYNARVETLRAHAGDGTATEELKEIEVHVAAGTAATAVLTELRGATGDEWDVVKVRMEESWSEIDGALGVAEAARRAREDREAGRGGPDATVESAPPLM
jgi:hypothetical protein